MLAIMRDRDESQDRLQQIAERLSGLGDNISDWADEDYVSEPGDDGDRFTVKYLVSTDKGKAPEPDVVAAEISTRAIASFIANAPRDIQFLLHEIRRLTGRSFPQSSL